jgi:hypothetical protein
VGRATSVDLPTQTVLELPELCIPLLGTQRVADIFSVIRAAPSLGDLDQAFCARSVQGDFNSTTGRAVFTTDPAAEEWPVLKGASFELWNPWTGDLYGSIQPEVARAELQVRIANARRRAGSVFALVSPEDSVDSEGLPCDRFRLVYRRIARATDSRTLIATLIAPGAILVDTAPYLLWLKGTARDQALALGVLSSIPADWFSRRIVEAHVDGFIMNAFPVPRPAADDPLRRRVEDIAGRLAAVDERYTAWAEEVSVPVANHGARRDDLLSELDAAVGLLYGLDEDDLRVVFETFHENWDHRPRLAAVLAHMQRLRAA